MMHILLLMALLGGELITNCYLLCYSHHCKGGVIMIKVTKRLLYHLFMLIYTPISPCINDNLIKVSLVQGVSYHRD